MTEISTLISQDLFSQPGLSPASGGCRLLRPTQTGDRAEVELAFLHYLRIQLKEVKRLNFNTIRMIFFRAGQISLEFFQRRRTRWKDQFSEKAYYVYQTNKSIHKTKQNENKRKLLNLQVAISSWKHSLGSVDCKSGGETCFVSFLFFFKCFSFPFSTKFSTSWLQHDGYIYAKQKHYCQVVVIVWQ